MAPAKPKVIGLTGGIASGKSTVARLFAETGVPVIDADAIARKLRESGGEAHAAIVARFGTADPARLRAIVFGHAAERADLEAILHPLIRARSVEEIARHHDAEFVIYEATLLVETGRHRDLNGLIVVIAPRDLQRSRLIARDQVSEELADGIFQAQGGDELKRQAADWVIDNSGSVEDLRARVTALIQELKKPG